jgi:hypothetical protein
MFLVDAERAPQDDEDLRGQRIQLRQVFYPRLDIPHQQAPLLQHQRQIAEILTRHMPDD